MDTLKLGELIEEGRDAQRDAIHIAVAPAIAGEKLEPGEHVVYQDGILTGCTAECATGVVDPYLTRLVRKGERVWLFLKPGSITSLRHEWTHPAFGADAAPPAPVKSVSEEWMRAWALMNISRGYGYADIDADGKYEFAITMGHEMSVGPNQSATDEVNEEWWNHWEAITGKKGQRGEYFSCSC